MEDTVQLSTLLDYVLQKSYGDLTQLAELLLRKTDMDRKLDIVRYARHTRQLLIQLLALVKWAQSSDPVRHCAEVSSQINHHSWVFVDTADQLAHLARNTLQQAMMPNLSLAPAIDVLTTGSYPRLPTCIKDRIIPHPPLSLSEKEQTFEMLEAVIRYQLSKEHLPSMVQVKSIARGRVILTVPYELEVSLTVVGDDITLPWRLLDLKILVGQALPGCPTLVTEQQRLYLHQLVQSRLCSEDGSLTDLFLTLHHFCLSLQLDCLHAQVERLSVSVCGVYMKVEDYVLGHHVKLAYWRYSGPAFLLNDSTFPWPRITISVNPQSHGRQLITTHQPPLNVDLSLQADNLSLQDMLVQCIRVRSIEMLKELKTVFVGTCWEYHTTLLTDPPCLSITLSSSLTCNKLLLSIDIRMGLVVASLEGVVKHSNDVINKILQQIEDDVLSSRQSLPNHLGKLLSQLHLTHIADLVTSCGFTSSYSLPLLAPLSHTSLPLFVKLDSITYLIIATLWTKDTGTIEENFRLLRVVPASFLPMPDEETIPKAFFKVETLIGINPQDVFDQLTGIIIIDRVTSKLKHKLQDQSFLMPSTKRLCLRPNVLLPPLTSLLATENNLSLLQESLLSANITATSKVTSPLGTSHLAIYSVKGMRGQEAKERSTDLLSSLLLSYELWLDMPSVLCKMEFTNIFKPDSQPIVIKRRMDAKNIGHLIQNDWLNKSTLLHEVLELRSFIEEGHVPFKQCSIVNFDYETLVVQYTDCQIIFKAQGEGVVISCPSSSPHYQLSSTLQAFLHKTKSIPLLIQGLCLTKAPLSKFVAGFRTSHGFQIQGLTPSHLKLYKGNVWLNVQLSSEGGASFCGVAYHKESMPQIVTQATLIKILQLFLELQLTGKLPSDSQEESSFLPQAPPTSNYKSNTPFPIPSPRLSSPLPSIPSLPPPASEIPPGGRGLISLENPVWERHVTMSQLNSLLDTKGGGGGESNLTSLELFVGSLSLLLHWVREVSVDRYLFQQLIFVSVDRGVFSYKTDILFLSLSLHPSTMQSLYLSIKPAQDNVWMPNELQVLMDFFHNFVVTPPFSVQALKAFMQLFWIPVKTLKACINIMKLQMQPVPELPWKVEFCLIVPKNVDLGENAHIGSPGIIYRAKVLLFLNLIRKSDLAQVTLPILHDPKTNHNFVAKRTPSSSSTRSEQTPALQFIDQILRRMHSNSELMNSTNESSLAYSVKHLMSLNIPV